MVSPSENSKNRRSYIGIYNPGAKINREIANRIRKERQSGWSYRALANNFKVSKTLIAKIIRGELWV